MIKVITVLADTAIRGHDLDEAKATEALKQAEIARAREAGVEYVCQWVIDDLPTWLHTKHGRMMAMPYGLELNDSVVYAIEKHSSTEMKLRVEQTIRTFEREIERERQPRVLTLPVHPHLTGVPHRIGFFGEILDTLLARSDTVFMAGSQIADWYAAECRRLGSA